MTGDGSEVPLADRRFYLVETGVGVAAAAVAYVALGAVVGGAARPVVAVVVGLVVANGLQWYRQ